MGCLLEVRTGELVGDAEALLVDGAVGGGRRSLGCAVCSHNLRQHVLHLIRSFTASSIAMRQIWSSLQRAIEVANERLATEAAARRATAAAERCRNISESQLVC